MFSSDGPSHAGLGLSLAALTMPSQARAFAGQKETDSMHDLATTLGIEVSPTLRVRAAKLICESLNRELTIQETLVIEDVLRGDIAFLADDAMQGRQAGRQFLENEVTHYLEKVFEDLGLAPCGNKDRSSFRQPFIVDWQHNTVAPKETAESGASASESNSHSVGKPPVDKPRRKSLRDRERSIAQTYPVGSELSRFSFDALRTHNLLGYMEGSDPKLRHEVIVVCAHMDHLGIDLLAEPGEDNIFNGADDNASGVAAMLATAAALKTLKDQGVGPKRSVLFAAWSAEEMGLLGSKFFVKHPTVSLDSISGVVNLEMLGRGDAASIEVLDSDAEGKPNYFHHHHGERAHRGEPELRHDLEHVRTRSDHAPFAAEGIPFLLISSAFNPGHSEDAAGAIQPDYHTVEDEIGRIDFACLRAATRFCVDSVRSAANHN